MKNAGLEISFQSALKSVKQAKVLLSIVVLIAWHFPSVARIFNSATGHLSSGTFSKIILRGSKRKHKHRDTLPWDQKACQSSPLAPSHLPLAGGPFPHADAPLPNPAPLATSAKY